MDVHKGGLSVKQSPSGQHKGINLQFTLHMNEQQKRWATWKNGHKRSRSHASIYRSLSTAGGSIKMENGPMAAQGGVREECLLISMLLSPSVMKMF